MARLSVNINKIATLRNARGGDMPNLVAVAEDLIRFGATSITVHPRPDERHITRQDAQDISKLLGAPEHSQIEYNIEGYPNPELIELVTRLRPDQYTLVPDPPEALTSNAGWKLPDRAKELSPVLDSMRAANIRTSIFVDPKDVDENYLKALLELNPDRVELYTEAYAKDFKTEKRLETLNLYKKAAEQIFALGIDINAGHDLNLHNLNLFLENLPMCKEVSIGHALICESLYLGLEACTKAYLKIARDK